MAKIVLDKENSIIKVATEGGYGHIVGIGDNARWELCSEEIARTDYENKVCTEDELRDGGIYFPKEDSVMPFDCGAEKIIEVEIPAEIQNPKDYKYINGEFVINNEIRINSIKIRLAELDLIINRATEDLYKATEATPYTTVEEAIKEKEALRAELATLLA